MATKGDRVRLIQPFNGLQRDSEGVVMDVTPFGLKVRFTHVPPNCTPLSPPILKAAVPPNLLASDTQC